MRVPLLPKHAPKASPYLCTAPPHPALFLALSLSFSLSFSLSLSIWTDEGAVAAKARAEGQRPGQRLDRQPVHFLHHLNHEV